MPGEIWVSASGMQTDAWRIDALANDIANVDTVGFKAQLPSSGNSAPGSAYPAGLAVGPAIAPDVLAGGGVRPLGLRLDMSQGAATLTNRPLDLDIAGGGLFALQDPGGTTLYTRNGRFFVDANGALVDAQGRSLLSLQGQSIHVPSGASDVQVSDTGEISAMIGGKRIAVAQIGLVISTDSQGLQGLGVDTWEATPAAGALTTVAPGTGAAGRLQSGALEGSNADLSALLPDLLTAQRAYQMNSRAFGVGLQLWTLANQLKV